MNNRILCNHRRKNFVPEPKMGTLFTQFENKLDPESINPDTKEYGLAMVVGWEHFRYSSNGI